MVALPFVWQEQSHQIESTTRKLFPRLHSSTRLRFMSKIISLFSSVRFKQDKKRALKCVTFDSKNLGPNLKSFSTKIRGAAQVRIPK